MAGMGSDPGDWKGLSETPGWSPQLLGPWGLCQDEKETWPRRP